MKLLFLICFIQAANQALSLSEVERQEWNTFKLQHTKVYSSLEEEKLRLNIFLQNKEKVIKHNEAYEKGEVSFKLGLNSFSDMTDEEFSKTMKGFIPNKKFQNPSPQGHPRPVTEDLPASIDWREKGAVTPVLNQGSCACCWAISAASSIAGQQFVKTGKLVELSEQNLIDCAGRSYQCYGCDGGDMRGAMKYVIDNEGIDTEQYYPFTAMKHRCRFSEDTIGATISSYVGLPAGDVQALKEAVATYGPISIGINSSPSAFKHYSSGIFDLAGCPDSFNDLDHGVLLVGYDSENGTDYWIVKNSWGTSWGEDGYVKMAVNGGNCGVASYATYAVI